MHTCIKTASCRVLACMYMRIRSGQHQICAIACVPCGDSVLLWTREGKVSWFIIVTPQMCVTVYTGIVLVLADFFIAM